MRRAFLIGFSITAVLMMSACSSHTDNDAANSAAGRLGQAAHKVMKQADKAAQSMGKDLKRAARDAREGWKEEDRKSRAKDK